MIIRIYWHNKTYGGNEFVDVIDEKQIRTGNTTSTGWDLRPDLMVEVPRLKDVKAIVEQLESRELEDLGRK